MIDIKKLDDKPKLKLDPANNIYFLKYKYKFRLTGYQEQIERVWPKIEKFVSSKVL